jgi:hypothetical protein
MTWVAEMMIFVARKSRIVAGITAREVGVVDLVAGEAEEVVGEEGQHSVADSGKNGELRCISILRL